MSKKKSPYGYGKYTPNQYRENLADLEAYYGSRAKAARELGISVDTFTRHMTGKTKPLKEISTKVNRKVGRLKQKLAADEVQAKKQKKKQQAEARAEKQRNKVKYMPTSTWVKTVRPELTNYLPVIQGIAPYVAYQGEDAHVVQFTDMFTPIGRPPMRTKVKVWALYSPYYTTSMDVPPVIIGSLATVAVRRNEHLSLRETIERIVKTFTPDKPQKGRSKYVMSDILGYELI